MGFGDVLTGGGTSTTGGQSTISSSLSGLANTIFPGLGSLLGGILNGLRCLGNQAVTNADYNAWENAYAGLINTVAADGQSNISAIQGAMDDIEYYLYRWVNVDMPKLVNPCSKELQGKLIELAKATRQAVWGVYNLGPTYQKNINGYTVTCTRLLSRKQGVSPSTTTNSPTNPPYNPPVTNPPTNPPVNTNTGNTGSGTTQPDITPTTGVGWETVETENGDGTKTLTQFNNGVFVKQVTVPSSLASSLTGDPIDINGNIGGWTFGVSNGQNNQMMYILGGLGALAAIFMLTNKKRK
ncbi:hypothetical protein [Epilithonimonas mollis]|uniref:Uncharacterized protein n=1 Tax=Epilithonimonas mollis TaxID=216903 RepID=A0A1M6U2E7_9FLAO|nr:hypothetical protein [Epilithonimonas mollis]SHK63377.1 hypothetical protein SAMN05444371_3082 [Epilithonimonas mollis]